MNQNNFFIVILSLGIATFFLRFSFIAFSSKLKISPRVKEILTFIPVAILPALLAPMVFFHQGEVDILMGKERTLVIILASFVCYFSKSMLMTILFGIFGLYLVTQMNFL